MALFPYQDIITPVWAVTRLGLHDSELSVFAVIYTAMKHGHDAYIHGINFLCEFSGRKKRQIMYSLRKLQNKGFVESKMVALGNGLERKGYCISKAVCCDNNDNKATNTVVAPHDNDNDDVRSWDENDFSIANSILTKDEQLQEQEFHFSLTPRNNFCILKNLNPEAHKFYINLSQRDALYLSEVATPLPKNTDENKAIHDSQYECKKNTDNCNSSSKDQNQKPDGNVQLCLFGEVETVSMPKTSRNAKKTPSEKPPKISFDWESGNFNNITEHITSLWQKAYPAVNIEQALSEAACWLISNPTKRKSNYERFICNWLSRCQDRGGNMANNNGGYQTGYATTYIDRVKRLREQMGDYKFKIIGSAENEELIDMYGEDDKPIVPGME